MDKQIQYEVKPKRRLSTSPAAVFCVILGLITIFGGVYYSYKTADAISNSKYNVELFLKTFMVFGIGGGFLLCMAELLQNVKSIADSLKGFDVRVEEAEQNDPQQS